ncbi:MAG: AGE family epimerase/isomerase [Oscillospiraceae bacterium]|jgi:mannobiose 2-epimerase|nr:AGE family epimerase/isomerase [Oscillospiraceae bacterium]
MINEIKKHLTDDIIPFWKQLRDDEFGGFYGRMDFNLEVCKTADKGGILNSRILWFFSNAYLTLGDKSCLEYAKHAYEFLKKAFYDKKHSGMFWSADYKGEPKDTAKYTYSQAFAVYALASYYDANKDYEALDLAYELVRIIERKCRNEAGYLEAFDYEFKPIGNEQLSENGVVADRTMNTLLHVYEAYTELYRVHKNYNIAAKLKWMLDLFANKVYNSEKKRLDVFFDLDYKPIIDLTSYGHDIEASWLIDRGTDILGIPRLPFTKILAEQIHAVALDTDGSVFNENEAGKVDTKKVWWVQAEALLGFLNAGDAGTAEQIWNYIKTKMIDSRSGSEWFNELQKDGTPIETDIVNGWKCPYHNGRMCLEVINRDNR